MGTLVILHIGTAKTGTTALQHCLYKLHRDLMEHSISYPNVYGSGFGWQMERGLGSGNADTNQPYAWESANQNERLRWIMSKALDENPQFSTIVLSSEVLSRLAIDEAFWKTISGLKTDKECDVRVVAYVRDPFKMFISCYQQFVKQRGYTGSLEDYKDLFGRSEYTVSFCFQENIQNIAQYAAKYSVKLNIHRYESALPSIERHFFKTELLLDSAQFHYEPLAFNHSLTLDDVEFLRGVNSVSLRLGLLLAYELDDTTLPSYEFRNRDQEMKYLLSETCQKELAKVFYDYRSQLDVVSNFADEVNFTIDQQLVTDSIGLEEVARRRRLFNLGRTLASSYEHGYIRWGWANPENLYI